MALSGAQNALLDRIHQGVRQGQLRRRPCQFGEIEAGVLAPGTVRLKIDGVLTVTAANDWVAACAAKIGRQARRQPSSDNRLIIDITL